MSDLSPDQLPDNMFSSELWLLKISALIGAFFVVIKFIKKIWTFLQDLVSTTSKIKILAETIVPERGETLKESILNMKSTIESINKRQLFTEHRERAVLQESSIMIFEFDGKGNLTWANKSYVNLTGRSLDELLDRGWENTISQDDRDRVVKEFRGAEVSDRDFESKYSILNAKTSSIIKIICRATVIKNTPNEAIGWIGIIKPIS